MKWKIILPIILLLIIGAILFIFYYLQQAMNQVPEYENNMFVPIVEEQPEQDETGFPEPTGNVDDTADAVINSLSDEESLIQDEKDAGLIDVENQALSDFGQSYDENEF